MYHTRLHIGTCKGSRIGLYIEIISYVLEKLYTIFFFIIYIYIYIIYFHMVQSPFFSHQISRDSWRSLAVTFGYNQFYACAKDKLTFTCFRILSHFLIIDWWFAILLSTSSVDRSSVPKSYHVSFSYTWL